MKYIYAVTFVIAPFLISAQSNTTVHYLNAQFNEIDKKKEAAYVRSLTQLADSIYLSIIQDKNGKLKSEGMYVFSKDKFVEHGEFIFYYPNGQVESKGYYEMGIKTGEWLRYTSTGARKASRYYDPESATLIRQAMKE